MDSEQIKKYEQAGKIAKEAVEFSQSLIEPGKNLFEIVEKIENKIKEKAEIAFPVTICANEIGAHLTPKWNDASQIGNDVVKVDLGVSVDGYIADTAYTIDFTGKYSKMLEVNKLALENALKMVKDGAKISSISKVIEETIKSGGFKPIENLTGHEVKQYDLHGGIVIPNIEVPYNAELTEGMVVAIEPFATDGFGEVIESSKCEIFSLNEVKPVRMSGARELLSRIAERKKLPFAKRWFHGFNGIDEFKLNLIIQDMVNRGIIKRHPMLHEKTNGVISQFEHTVIVGKDESIVTTL